MTWFIARPKRAFLSWPGFPAAAWPTGSACCFHQGARALELWTGQNPPIEVMREALRKNVYGG